MTITCKCKNHLGGPKTCHKTKVAAIEVGLRHGRGNYVVYRCPDSDRWHVAVHKYTTGKTGTRS